MGEGKYCSLPCRIAASRNQIDDFWSSVDRAHGADACWLWVGKTFTYGYGIWWYQGRKVRAHRFSWELTHGPIPDGLQVCHNCPGGDNRACCNPRHLFLGTAMDNAHDRDAKGRTRILSGSQHGNARFIEENVREIRRRFESRTSSVRELASEFGVSGSAIYSILSRTTWRDV